MPTTDRRARRLAIARRRLWRGLREILSFVWWVLRNEAPNDGRMG